MPGSTECIANLVIERAKLEVAGRQAVKNWAYEVLRVSMKDYCPVDTGTLRRSGRVQVVLDTMARFYIRIGYTAEYALAVHELDIPHDVGSMKYLSTPFNLMSYRLMKKIEADVGAVL